MSVETEVREWVFTFGFGQCVDGVALAGKYVRIRGTADDARAEMLRRFGRTWAFQYESEEAAGVERFGLQEYR